MFAYLYYRIFSTYKYKWNDSIPGVYAICLVSILQFLNLTSIQLIIFYFSNIKWDINRIYGALIVALLIGLNYYRFYIHSNFSLLEKKWQNETKQKKTRNGILIIIYIVFSVLFFLLLANYLSEINRM